MAGISIWQAFQGVSEGRIQPTRWVAPDGDWVLCLGSDVPHVTGRLKVGDNVNVSQSGNYPNAVMRLLARTRGPTFVPDGCWWEASVLVGGTPVVVRRVDVGQQFDFADLGWEMTSGASGSLGFQLTMQGPANLIADAELPAFYLDEISFSAAPASDTRVYNRFPEPDSAGAPFDSDIAFDLFPDSTDPTTITVTVNGAPAIVGGAFTLAFDGPNSAITTTGNGNLHFEIDPLAIWGDEESVTVVVSSTDPDAAPVSWTFSAQRTSGPHLVSASPQDLNTILVTFDEAPIAASAANLGDALNPASYAIARTPGVISVQPSVVAVAAVSATSFAIQTDLELSPGAPYTLSLVYLEDELGNVTEPFSPFGTLGFVAWSPPVPKGRSFQLYDLVPQKNRDEDQTGELLAFLSVLQDPLNLLLYAQDSFSQILDPTLAPERFVDAMLADLGNPFSFPLTLTQKRQLVELLLPIYQQKGTPQGIENAIRLFLGITCVHEAWGIGATLDGDAVLGDGGSFPGSFVLGSTVGLDPFGFVLLVSELPTGTVLEQANQIVAFMQRGECVFLGFRTSESIVTLNPVILDGVNSVLGDGWDGTFPGTFILHDPGGSP